MTSFRVFKCHQHSPLKMKNEPFRVVASNVDSCDARSYVLTIAVPTFKRPALLEQALRSISVLAFSIPVEVIVLDNDPDGDDAQAARLIDQSIAGPYHYYRNLTNVGMFGNWNQCLLQARGQYITILHDDDLLCVNFGNAVETLLVNGRLAHEIVALRVFMLEERPDRLENNVAQRLRRARLRRLLAGGAEEKSISLLSITDLFFANHISGTLGVIFNREKAVELGGFQADWYPIADYEFWCRWVTRYGPIPIVNQRVAQYRIGHNESMKLQTRDAFVTKSHELRRDLVRRNFVPRCFTYLIGIAGFSQRGQVYGAWRAADEAPLSIPMKFALLVCDRTFPFISGATKRLGFASSAKLKDGK